MANNTNNDTTTEPNSPHPSALYGYILLLVSLVLLAESTLTIFINKTCETVRGRASTKLVTNLAVSGGLMGASMGLFSVYSLSTTDGKQVVDEVRHVMLKIIPHSLHIVSVLSLCCLTLDRYVAVCWPLRYHDLLTPSRCRGLTVASWVIPALVFVPGLIISYVNDNKEISIISYLVLFLTATVAIVLMYVLLAKEFRGEGSGRLEMKEDDRRVRYRTTRDVLVIVMLNLLLSFPHVGVFLDILVSDNAHTNRKYRHVLHFLLLVHQVLFLPVYAWKNADFRNALLARCDPVRRCCCCCS